MGNPEHISTIMDRVMKQQIEKHNKDSIIAKRYNTGTWINKGAALQDRVSPEALNMRVQYQEQDRNLSGHNDPIANSEPEVSEITEKEKRMAYILKYLKLKLWDFLLWPKATQTYTCCGDPVEEAKEKKSEQKKGGFAY